MVRTSDLLPRSSGLAHIGVDAGGADAFDASSITPYGLVHMISGVWHDPVMGTSGIIRFSQAQDGFEFSTDGGASFTKFKPTLTLQEAYENGATVVLDSGAGTLTIGADTAKLVLEALSTTSPLRLAPQNDGPTANQVAGDLWFSRHSVVNKTLGYSNNEVVARSLGYGSLAYDTGSGVVNFATGSGIAQFSASTAATIATGAGSDIPWDTVDIQDDNYALTEDSGISGIRIFSPGLYEITYHCSYDKISGSTRRTIETDILVNLSPQQPSSVFSYHRDTAAGEGTGVGTIMLQLAANDVVATRVRFASTGAANEVASIANECWIIFKKLGPPRRSSVTT